MFNTVVFMCCVVHHMHDTFCDSLANMRCGAAGRHLYVPPISVTDSQVPRTEKRTVCSQTVAIRFGLPPAKARKGKRRDVIRPLRQASFIQEVETDWVPKGNLESLSFRTKL